MGKVGDVIDGLRLLSEPGDPDSHCRGFESLLTSFLYYSLLDLTSNN